MSTRADTPSPVFPREADIPESARQGYYDRAGRYLAGGVVREWQGAFQEVLSPVCISGGDAGTAQKAIGRHPLMGEAEALDALE